MGTNVFLKLTTKQSFVAKPTQEIHEPRLLRKESTQNTRSVLAVATEKQKRKNNKPTTHTDNGKKALARERKNHVSYEDTQEKKKTRVEPWRSQNSRSVRRSQATNVAPHQSSFPCHCRPTLSTHRLPWPSCFGLTAYSPSIFSPSSHITGKRIRSPIPYPLMLTLDVIFSPHSPVSTRFRLPYKNARYNR